jgi:hypothetical protein
MALASLKDETSISHDVEAGVTEASHSENSAPAPRVSGAAKLKELFHAQSEKFDEEQMPTPGKVTVIESLQGYEGDNLYEKLDAFIKAHEIAMVNRSWCLFSIDAVDFLSRMGIAVHSFEVDNHSHEKYLVKHLKQKYSHDT